MNTDPLLPFFTFSCKGVRLPRPLSPPERPTRHPPPPRQELPLLPPTNHQMGVRGTS